MYGPTCIFWANLTPFSLQLPVILKFHCGVCKSFSNLVDLPFLEVLNFDMLTFTSLDCTVEIDHITRFYFTVCAPIVLIVAIQVFARLHPQRRGRVVPTEGDVVDHWRRAARHELHSSPTDSTNQASLAIIFLAYPTVRSKVLNSLPCLVDEACLFDCRYPPQCFQFFSAGIWVPASCGIQ
jgi:hypothetical protein